MPFEFEILFCVLAAAFCGASYHEQYRVPIRSSDKWEAYVFEDKEYIIQNIPVTWENANILCRGQHNGSLAVLDSRERAEFMAEALSELQFSIESVWIGARRNSAEDPEGYRWTGGVGLRRTAGDILASEKDGYIPGPFPVWLNRTHVPVPEGGADCVALERVAHDRPVFLDLPCSLDRPFVCEKDARVEVSIKELRVVRCQAGVYRLYDGRLAWTQAAAYCLLRKMTLANISTMKCLKKLGLTMLKSRPSIESAWVGARGTLGRWSWLDSGNSIFQPALDSEPVPWPPMRDSTIIKQDGCLQLDRHSSKAPVFLEARCERKMQFICYQGASPRATVAPPSDDNYNYILVRQLLYWQHAVDNCRRMNGSLASVDNHDGLVQLLLVMGEDKDEPVEHIWISGRLNVSKDPSTDAVTYSWYNPYNGRRIPDHKSVGTGAYIPPWLDEAWSTDAPCLNLDRQEHLAPLLYGLPCDTAQRSVCLLEKSTSKSSQPQPDMSEMPEST